MFTIYRERVQVQRDLRVAYNRLYRDPQSWLCRRDALAHWLLDLVDARPGGSFLDVACGDGTLVAMARSMGLDSYGLDLSDQAVHIAQQRLGEGLAVIGDGATLPFSSGAFDYVTSIGSLEHYVCMEPGVRELARVLKPDGLACILLPNAFGLTWNVWHAWRTGDLADDGYQPVQRFATRQAWQSLLEENGLVVQRIVGYEQVWPRTADERRYYRTHFKEFLWLLLSPFIPLNLARCFVFLCKPLKQGSPAAGTTTTAQSAGAGSGRRRRG